MTIPQASARAAKGKAIARVGRAATGRDVPVAKGGGKAAKRRPQPALGTPAERLQQAEFRVATLEWQLETLRNRKLWRILVLLQAAARNPRELPRLPLRLLRVVARPTPSRPKPKAVPKPPPNPMVAARKSLAAGDYEAVLECVDAALAEDPRDMAALDLKHTAHWRRGDVTPSVSTLRVMRSVRDSPKLAARERALLGRSRELDPRWLPRIAGPPAPYEPDPDGVLHLFKESYPYLVNGFTMRNRYTLQAQRAAGLNPVVVTSLGFPRKIGETVFSRVEVLEGTPHHRLDLGPDYRHDGPFDTVLSDTAWLTARVAQEVRPAVIHASAGYRGYETGLVGMALRDHLDRPFVYEIRSFHETTWTGDAKRAEVGEHVELRRAAENRCMASAEAVITIAEGMRSEIIARGIPAEKVFVVPNGVDADVFTPREPDLELRRRHGLQDRAVIGYVSNLDHPREGHEILIEAAARLRQAGRDVACLIVGDGQRRAKLEAFARASGAGDAIIFTGRVPHELIQDMYALIDVFVVPRIDDHAARLVTPLKPFEAMAMGRPVVVADLPALVELVKPDERGLAFVPGDPASLAKSIEVLLDQPDLAFRLAAEGRRWVLAERTWLANGPRYRHIYDQVLDRWSTRATTGAVR